jgi:outer membrane protein OmpA-like peptidoglycan-associated protein
MNRSFFIAVLVTAALPLCTQAQFKGLGNRIKNKITQRADNKIDQQVDKTLDAIEGKKSPEKNNSEPVPVATTTGDNAVKSYAAYDFVPGEQVLYYENFDQEPLAELPAGWNTSGSGEVVTLDKFPGKWLRLHKSFTYLTANTKTFGENYSIEFDAILQLKNNGWMYPEFTFGFLASGDEASTDNSFLKDNKRYAAVTTTIFPNEFKATKAQLKSWQDKTDYFQSDLKGFESLEQSYGTPFHVSVQVQKERLRLWVNEEKLFDVPKGIPVNYVMNQLLFEIGSTNYQENQYAIYLGNIKVATGKPDTRHKLAGEGKFSTTGILFDINAASIKPESHGTLKEVAAVLTENKDMHIKIIGHTDSDGSETANLTLSEKRAAAVKEALVNEFSIAADRISTEGKGESEPVADNKTKEGKAANRRVEFVKE